MQGDRGFGRSLFDLSGRVAVVTGGTTGLGHAIALDENDWLRVMETNLTGTRRACQIFGCPYPRGDRTSSIPAGFDLPHQWIAEPQDRMTLQQNARGTKNANQSRLL
jgi:hypothetical protein